MDVFVITDNMYIYENFKLILARKPTIDAHFEFFYSYNNPVFGDRFGSAKEMMPINLKTADQEFFNKYELFISLHCKQIFPPILVDNHLCINVHPGYNPYNRGWYPQVFSILNKFPLGVTIHKIDNEIDHGSILYQKEISVCRSETSKDIYMRLLALEMQLLEEHLDDILSGNYELKPMSQKGNINTKRDFDNLCKIDMEQDSTFGEVIDYLRAMTFSPYKNAYFYDTDGKKVYVSIILDKEK